MSTKLTRALTALFADAACAGATLLAGLAAFLLAGAGMTVLHIDARAVLPSARAENVLLQRVLLKPEENLVQRAFTLREKRAIEHAIRTQIRAYATRNANLAFAKLAPSTQRFFGQPDRFLRSVAQDIPAILDTRRFAFLGVEQIGRRIVQQVLITDSIGSEWLAEFQLEQLKNGDWRIKGCVVQGTPGQQAHSPSSASDSLA
jgi:hypothetical protein